MGWPFLLVLFGGAGGNRTRVRQQSICRSTCLARSIDLSLHTPDPVRTRKLLLHRRELGQVFGGVQKDGFTCVPVSLYWKKGFAKCDIALAKGKQKFDKRATEKERDWNRQKQRLMRQG